MSDDKLTIEQYKTAYTHKFNFHFNDDSEIYIVLTPSIIAKEAMLLNKLNKFNLVLHKYSIRASELKLSNLAEIVDKSYVSQVIYLASQFGIKVNVGILADIAFRGMPPTTKEEVQVYDIFKIFKRLEEGIELTEISRIISEETDFRDFDGPKNERGYDGFPSPRLEMYYKRLRANSFSEDFPPMICASVAYWVLRYGKFWKRNNKAMSFFGFFDVLAKSGYGDVLMLAKFLETLVNSDAELDAIFNKSLEQKGDITYVYSYFIDKLDTALSRAETNFDEINYMQKNEASHISMREKKIQAQKMMQKNPMMSRKQAEFFVTHCEENIAYTIQDFVRSGGTSYETGRYSMEALVKLGFYKKVKVGKNFAYYINK